MNAVCGDGASDPGVGSVVVVMMDPVLIGRGSSLVAGVGPRIGPFLREGAVEAFDLPIRLWPIRPRVPVLRIPECPGEGA